MLQTIYHKDDVKGYEAGYLDSFWNDGENRIYVAEDDAVRAFVRVFGKQLPAKDVLVWDDPYVPVVGCSNVSKYPHHSLAMRCGFKPQMDCDRFHGEDYSKILLNKAWFAI